MSYDLATRRIDPAVAGLVLALVGSSLVWVLRDVSVWPWDQAWYGEVALDLAQSRRAGLLAWTKDSLAAFGAKPPLLAWLAQFFAPLSRWLGDIEPALLLVNVLAQFAALLVIASVCARMGAGRLAQASAVLVLGGSSLALGLSHQFLTETLQMLSVALMLHVMWGVERRALSVTAAAGILLAALAMLVKASSVTFVLPFATYCIVAVLIRREDRRPAGRALPAVLFPAAMLALAACAGWYWVNWRPMTQHFRNATLSDVALAYGSVGTLDSKLSFWVGSLAEAISPSPWTAVLAAVPIMLAMAVVAQQVGRAPWRVWPAVALANGFLYAAALAGTVALTVLGLALQINEETRFLSPLLPILAVLGGWGLTVLRSRRLAILVVTALALNAAYAVSFAHGYDPIGIRASVWLKPVTLDADRKALLAQVVRQSCSASQPNRYTVVGVEYPDFNANSAAFFSAKQRRRLRYRCYYTSLGYAEVDLDKALARIDSLDADFVVTFAADRQREADVFNRISNLVVERLKADPRFTPIQGGDAGLMVFQRRR